MNVLSVDAKSGALIPRFWLWHLVYPLLLFAMLFVLGQWLSWDSNIADYFFQQEGGVWSLRNHWLLSDVLHKGGKYLSVLLALIIACVLCGSFFIRFLQPWRRVLAYLFLSATSASILIGLAKHSLAISCPWEFSRYGGDKLYLPLLQQLRGAHFLTHDLTTLMLCWLVALLLYWILLVPEVTSARAPLFAKGGLHCE